MALLVADQTGLADYLLGHLIDNKDRQRFDFLLLLGRHPEILLVTQQVQQQVALIHAACEVLQRGIQGAGVGKKLFHRRAPFLKRRMVCSGYAESGRRNTLHYPLPLE